MQHAKRIGVAHIVAKIDHCLQAMLFDQSADALSRIGHHWRKQFKGELSAAVAHAMPFGNTAHAVAQENSGSSPIGVEIRESAVLPTVLRHNGQESDIGSPARNRGIMGLHYAAERGEGSGTWSRTTVD
jgi:hypothetical protein